MRRSQALAPRSTCRVGIALCLGILMSACTKWTPTPLSPGELLETEAPREIRVIKSDGTESVAERPSIVGDSIYATMESCGTSLAAGGITVCEETSRAVAALGEVQRIEVPETDAATTMVAVVLLPAVLIALLLAAACSDDSSGGIGSPCG